MTQQLCTAAEIEAGQCFRKKTGEFCYLRISNGAVRHAGLDPDMVHGVCYNGNMAAVKPHTLVWRDTLAGLLANYNKERDWEDKVGVIRTPDEEAMARALQRPAAAKPELFNLQEHTGISDPYYWAFIAICAVAKDLPASFDEACRRGDTIEMALTFNGHPVSFKHVLDRLFENYDHALERRAAEISKERAGALTNCIDDIARKVRAHAMEELRVAFPSYNLCDD